MRKNSKGFTLVELLAVIVILAIIALITTPIILNVIEKSRQNAAVDKAWGTIDAVRLAYSQAQDPVDPVGLPFTVNFPKGTAEQTCEGGEGSSDGTNTNTPCGTITATGGGWGTGYVNKQPVAASGEMPQNGFVTMLEDGSIIAYQLQFGRYYCSTIDKESNTYDSNSMICSRTIGDVAIDDWDTGGYYIGGQFEGAK